MPKVTEAHLEARRQQILEAASSCFARRGFHQCTMHDICGEAQLSPGAVYRYFSSKEEIIEAMAEDSRRRGEALAEAAREQGDTIRVLDHLADAFFGMLDDSEGCVLDIELWAEAARNPRMMQIFRRIVDSHRDSFAEIVRLAQERGDVNPRLDPEAVARVMMSFYEGLVLQRAVDPSVDVRRYVAVMKAMMSGFFWQGRKLEGS